jgi:hypothetical protein
MKGTNPRDFGSGSGPSRKKIALRDDFRSGRGAARSYARGGRAASPAEAFENTKF